VARGGRSAGGLNPDFHRRKGKEKAPWLKTSLSKEDEQELQEALHGEGEA
jgi:uncharacterized membrane protein